MKHMAAPYLPEPTGPHPVGTIPSVEMPSRDLTVSAWYPTTATAGRRADYVTSAEAEAIVAGRAAPDALTSVRTNAFRAAPPNAKLRMLPLVVLSPGFGRPRGTLTSIAEDLASHGYVVAAIDRPHELAIRGDHPHDPAFWANVGARRVEDVSLVLDELVGPRWPVDPERIGMAGHSVGGAATIAAMLADARIRAGANVDGSTDPVIPAAGLDRPFLLLGRDGQYSPGDGPAADTWSRDWALLTGWRRWLVVRGAVHASFTDLGLLADQLGLPIGARTPGLRAMALTRACLRTFFDIHLRGQSPDQFDHLGLAYPELADRPDQS
jgi:predicted dienelactone hydrolase